MRRALIAIAVTVWLLFTLLLGLVIGAEDGYGAQWRSALASWYGPGLYGHRTACGIILTPHTQGVANRTLPCGKRIRVRYRGRVVTVRVIDRGPAAPPRTFDIAAATAARLLFTGVAPIQWRPA